MNKYNIEVRVNDNGKIKSLHIDMQAESLTHLASEIQGLQQLNKTLSHDDFMQAKELIIQKPQLVTTIKEVINETEDLSETQMLMKAPSLIRRFIKVLKD